MLKKYFAIALLASAAAMPASFPVLAQDSVEIVEMTEVIAPVAGAEESVSGDAALSAETASGVQESALAKKMSQAEKAKNAAENDSWGGAITIIAMAIVIMALVVLSLLFLGFGKISQFFLTRKKKEAKEAANHESDHSHEDLDSGEVIAAIAAALSEHFGGNHDIEDTILTIRRMKKAYSPWSSKLYGLRHYPDSPLAHPGGNALRNFSSGNPSKK